MNNTYLANAPVNFGDDINNLSCDDCFVKMYNQLTDKTDTIIGQYKISTCGSDVVLNGKFNSDTNWTKDPNWTISNGVATSDGSNGDLTQSGILTAGKIYDVTFDVIGRTTGAITPVVSGQTGTPISANGRKRQILHSADNFLRFEATSGFDGSIDNVVAIEMDLTIFANDKVINGGFATDTDWTKGTGWTISAGVATHGTGTASNITSAVPLVIDANRFYKLKYTVSSRTAGTIQPNIGTDSMITRSTNGTFEEVILHVSEQHDLFFSASSDFDGSIDDVELLEYKKDVINIVDKDQVFVNAVPPANITINNSSNYIQFSINNTTDNNTAVKNCFKIHVVEACGGANVYSQTYFMLADVGCTLLLEWDNSFTDSATGQTRYIDAFGFQYRVFPANSVSTGTGLIHRLRLEGKVRKARYEGDKDFYQFSSGEHSLQFAHNRKIYTLDLAEIPDYLHDAIANGLAHRNFTIDGVRYTFADLDYEPIWRNSSTLAPVTVDIEESIQDLFNVNC